MESILKRVTISLAVAALVISGLLWSFVPSNAEKIGAIELPNEAVSKEILDNGLVLLSKECPPSGLVAIDVKIRAGSSLEEEYLASGISHLAEHMVFKGTKTRGPGVIEKEIKSYGGSINGSVSQDLTGYSVIVPSAYSPEAVAILKDMLTNASFDKAELEKEKEVILKEMRLDNDEPQSLLIRLLNRTAYLDHAYKYPPIGYEEKFRALTRDDVVKYYNRMYAPNRMVVAIAGGLSKSGVVSRAKSEFGSMGNANYAVIGLSPVEPEQIEKRNAGKRIETNLTYLAIGYHSTSVLNEDLFAMDILAMVLGRGNNSLLNTSLYKRDKLVHSISSWNMTPRDPGLFTITAMLDPDKLPAAEAAIFSEVNKVRSGPLNDTELESAKRMVLADYIFGLQTIDAQAANMTTDYILTGSYDFSRRYVKGIQAVRAEDVKRVANKYLRDDGATIVTVTPKNFKEPAIEANAASTTQASAEKMTLPNGLRIVLTQNKNTPTVSITAAIGGGLASEDLSDNGISNLVSRMLLKGTSTRPEDKIASGMESLGGAINPFSGADSLGLDLEFLKADADNAVAILQDTLANSIFPPEEFERERMRVIAAIREEDEDIFYRAVTALRAGIFGNDHYGLRPMGTEDSVKAITVEGAVGYYKKYVVPGNIVISASGDFDIREMAEKLTKAFSPLRVQEAPKAGFEQKTTDKIEVSTITMDRQQSLVAFGFAAMDNKNPDRYAMDVLGSVLSGYSGRLFEALRNKSPFAYTLGCVHKEMAAGGFAALYAATTKENIRPVEEGLLKAIADIRKGTIADEEILHSKRELAADFAMKTQANAFISRSTAVDELCGAGYDNIFKYTANIEKVTKEDLRRTAEKYFNPDHYFEVIISQ